MARFDCPHGRAYYVGEAKFFCPECKFTIDYEKDEAMPRAKRPAKIPWWETGEDPKTWNLPPPPKPKPVVLGPPLTKKQWEDKLENQGLDTFMV